MTFKQHCCNSTLVIAILIGGLLMGGRASAEPQAFAAPQASPNIQTAAETPIAPAPDVRVVIDVSGSMKQNDPANLRQPAIDLLVKLLPENSKSGVWTFGQYVNMLIPHRPVNDEWKAQALAQIPTINSVGLFTNIGLALEKAAYDSASPNPDYQTNIILLTDGMVDISKDPAVNEKEWHRIVDTVIPGLRQTGYRVHTIALSDNADRELMNKLAIQTDGISAVAKNADELMKIFLRLLNQSAPAEQVPLEGNSFLIDSSINEFTALIFRQPGSQPTRLMSPDLSQYDQFSTASEVKWFSTDQYDLITLSNPLEGEWRVLADIDSDSRVTVVSNLNLRVNPLPGNIYVGETIDLTLRLQEQGKTITRKEFLNLLTITATLKSLVSGEETALSLATEVPDDGIYRHHLDKFQHQGEYVLDIEVDGKTFQRRYRHQLAVRPRFAVNVLELQSDQGHDQFRISVDSHSAMVRKELTQVVARIKDPRGLSSIKPLLLTARDNWQLDIEPDVEGTYNIRLRISGTDDQGNTFELDPEPINLSYPKEDGSAVSPPSTLTAPAEEPVAEVKEEQAPQPIDTPPDAVEEGTTNWLLYVGLGLGNLLVLGLAFLAYRLIMGGKSSDSIEELEAAVKELEEASTEPDTDTAAAEVIEAVSGNDDTELVELDEQPEAEADIQPIEMEDDLDAGVDLSSDEALETDFMADADDEVDAGGEIETATSENRDGDSQPEEDDDAAGLSKEAEDLLSEFDLPTEKQNVTNDDIDDNLFSGMEDLEADNEDDEKDKK